MSQIHKDAVTTDPMPTNNTVAVESKNDPQIRVLSDTTDAQGVRHVTLQTTATGTAQDGYEAAELQAKQWFFSNYDPATPGLDVETYTLLASTTTERGLSAGRISEEWLECPHPVIRNQKGDFIFGHHTGLNPTATELTWGFQFEILPMEAPSNETLLSEPPTEEEAYSMGLKQGRILAMNPGSQGQADWLWSNSLFVNEFDPDSCIGEVAAPPAIYADHDLMNAYCTGAVRGYSDYQRRQQKGKL